jgi:hypothetical protein
MSPGDRTKNQHGLCLKLYLSISSRHFNHQVSSSTTSLVHSGDNSKDKGSDLFVKVCEILRFFGLFLESIQIRVHPMVNANMTKGRPRITLIALRSKHSAP